MYTTQFKLFIYFFSFEIIIAKFLDKMIVKNLYAPLYRFYYQRLKNNHFYIYKEGSPLFFKIDLETDEIIEETKLPDNFKIYKYLPNGVDFFIEKIRIGSEYDDEYYVIFQKGKSHTKIQIYNQTHYDFELKSISYNYDSIYLLIIMRGEHYDFLSFKYPYSSWYKTNISNVDEAKWENFIPIKLIALKDACIIFCRYDNYKEKIYNFQLIDSNNNFLKSKNISIPENEILFDIEVSALSENEYFNEFIMCILFQNKSVCNLIKYENFDLIFGNDIEICSNLNIKKSDAEHSGFNPLSLFIYEQENLNNVLFLCNYNPCKAYDKCFKMSIAHYENGMLNFNKKYTQYKFIPEGGYLNSLKNAIVTVNKKGLSILHFYYDVRRFYINSVCDSKRIALHVNHKDNFPIESLVYEGIDADLEFSFFSIPNNLEIFHYSNKIKENEIFTDLNNFYYFFDIPYDGDAAHKIYHLYINMNNKNYFCDIEIEIFTETIEVGSENYLKCVKNKKLDRINNIKKTNLNKTFDIENKKEIELFFTYSTDLPKDNELIFYYENYKMKCKKNNYNVTCIIPIVILKMNRNSYIYSKLSCENLIELGWILINDKFIKDVFNLQKTLSYKEIRKIYHPSEQITDYNGNMINYYYWFSCLAYCDDKLIANKRCCPEILQDWEIVFHKEYYMDYNAFLKHLDSAYQISYFIYEPLIKDLVNQIIYYYNFAILKNNRYKKIICAFPGTTNYLQLSIEFLFSILVKIPNKNNENFKVTKMFYDIFVEIKNDLIGNLLSLEEFKDSNYQTLFIGHSLGGALATIASFYCINQNIIKSEPILITFGQPRVGNDLFAKYLTKNLKQIYRFARPKDIVTLIPLNEINTKKVKEGIFLILDAISLAGNPFIKVLNTILQVSDFIAEIVRPNYFDDFINQLFLYTHIGGLYMIDDNAKKIYRCLDFYNENTKHPICKNYNLFKSFTREFEIYHNYITLNDYQLGGCQKNKKMKYIIFRNSMNKKELKCNNPKYNYLTNNFLLNNKYYKRFHEIQSIESNKEFFVEYNVSEIWIQYKINHDIKNDDLILKINPEISLIFGTICFYQNLNLNSNDNNIISCFNIKTANIFMMKINIENISNENMLYFIIKGKISGIFELIDLSKSKILNTNFSYYYPKIEDIESSKFMTFSIPKIEENTFINIMINNKICSLFEIYENNNKIKCDDNIDNQILLIKGNRYDFKYYPYNNELAIHFFNDYSNNFLNKFLYTFNSQTLYIIYNLKDKNISDNLTLFIDINGGISIAGYFSNNSIFNNNIEEYPINSQEKFINIKNDKSSYYLNLKINIYWMNIYGLKIYDINEMIVINKINFKFNLVKGKNVFFNIDTEIREKYLKFESLILLSTNNEKNTIKLIESENTIKTSKNFLIINLLNIKGIFIFVEETDELEFRLIPEKISKIIYNNIPTIESNLIQQNNLMTMEYIYSTDYNFIFYEALNNIYNGSQIYILNSNFNLDNFINNKFDNFEQASELTILEPFKSYFFMKKCNDKCLFIKFINNELDFDYILVESQILYLFMDFEYKIIYNKNMTEIKIKKINNFENKITIICDDKIININNIEEIINIDKCDGEFIIKGNNNLIYIYIPDTFNDDYIIFNNSKSMKLMNIKEFFFIPEDNNYNYMNIYILNNDYLNNNESIFFTYHTDLNVLPFSRKIEKKYIYFGESINITIPNFKQNLTNKEIYYIYFNFGKIVSNINFYITYENIIILEDKETSFIIESGINILQLYDQENYYFNLIKSNINDSLVYSIYRNNLCNEEEKDIIMEANMISLSKTSINENIRIKIENQDDIFISISSELFYDLDMIIYDNIIYIEQLDNSINIKFNTTSYESKIEYYIIIDKDNNNITNLSNFLFHKIINSDNFIYRNVISSIGINPISINLDIEDYFIYNESYISYILGKENFGESFHYIYYEPQKFIIKNQEEEEKEYERENGCEEENKSEHEEEKKYEYEEENEKKQENEEDEYEEINDNSEENYSDLIQDKDSDNNESNIGLIIGLIFGVLGFFVILFISFYFYYYKNKRREKDALINNYSIN